MGTVKQIFAKITMTQVLLMFILFFIIVQVLFKISSKLFHTMDIRFGWVFLAIIVAFGLTLLYTAIVKKEASLNKRDLFVLIILSVALILLFLVLPKYIPEIFSFDFPIARQQITDFTQSIIG